VLEAIGYCLGQSVQGPRRSTFFIRRSLMCQVLGDIGYFLSIARRSAS
jgi:hypothetical protein